MKRCPKCGCKKFFVTAHVTQDWMVDEYGEFTKVIDDCVEVTHFADDIDIWDCVDCGYSDRGSVFNVENSTK